MTDFRIFRVLVLALSCTLWGQYALGQQLNMGLPGLRVANADIGNKLSSQNSLPGIRAVLEQSRVCVPSTEAQRIFRANRIAAQVVPLERARTALNQGLCDIHLSDFALITSYVVIQSTQPQPQPPATDDADRPPATDGADDVEVVRDTTPPVIRILETPLTASIGSVKIRAAVKDDSALAYVRIVQPETDMRPGADGVYSIGARLPKTYKPAVLQVVAADTFGNQSAPAEVTIRRIPHCGPDEGVTVERITAIQNNLKELGALNGSADGLLGPNTCGAIEGFLGGGISSWEDLEDRIDRGFITLKAPASFTPQPGANTITVQVLGERVAGTVRVIHMRPATQPPLLLPVQDNQAVFPVNWFVSAPERVVFEARDARGRVITSTVTQLGALAPEMAVSGPNLKNGVLKSPDATDVIEVSLSNIPNGAEILASGDRATPKSLSYTGGQSRFRLAMPDPGQSETLRVSVVYQGTELIAEEITLTRPSATLRLSGGTVFETGNAQVSIPFEVIGPVGSDTEVVAVASGSDQPIWRGRATSNGAGTATLPMPESGQQQNATLVLQQGDTVIDRATFTLIRPEAEQPFWLWPAIGGAIILLGLGIGVGRGFRGKAAATTSSIVEQPTFATKPAIKVIKDNTPEVSGLPADLPSLVVEVSPDEAPQTQLVFDDEESD